MDNLTLGALMPWFHIFTPEDRARDAFCYAVMLHLKKRYHYTSIKDEWFITKMRVFYSLLQLECREAQDLFSDINHVKRSSAESLSRAIAEKEMFRKSNGGNRYHFESGFDEFAEREIRIHLSQNFQTALNKILDDATYICFNSSDWKEALALIEKYKTTKHLNRGL